MLAQFPFLQKIWDKGLDITASVITSVIIAVLALLVWKLKLRLDLKAEEQKQRQQHRLQQEFSEEPQRKAAWQRYLVLSEQRDAHAASVQACTKTTELLAAVDRYEGWLQTENLQNFPKNIDFMHAIAGERENMRRSDHTRRLVDGLSDRIRKTELPPHQN